MQAETLRIGVTMRVLQAQGYEELRDALAQDWPRFLQAALPQAIWLPLPNLGANQILSYCNHWNINRLILTGGENIGSSDIRDKTEFALLDWASANNIPTLGICRGMQVISVWAGSNLKPVKNHSATRHIVHGKISADVNSFHNFGIDQCPTHFEVMAKSEDGIIEGIRHLNKPIEGWMWHPERELPPKKTDIEQLHRVFL